MNVNCPQREPGGARTTQARGGHVSLGSLRDPLRASSPPLATPIPNLTYPNWDALWLMHSPGKGKMTKAGKKTTSSVSGMVGTVQWLPILAAQY